MDRKKLEQQAQVLRNKRKRLEARANKLRPERPKITKGAVVQQERQVQEPLNPAPPSTSDVERARLLAKKKARAAALRPKDVKKTSGVGCGGCRRSR